MLSLPLELDSFIRCKKSFLWQNHSPPPQKKSVFSSGWETGTLHLQKVFWLKFIRSYHYGWRKSVIPIEFDQKKPIHSFHLWCKQNSEQRRECKQQKNSSVIIIIILLWQCLHTVLSRKKGGFQRGPVYQS